MATRFRGIELIGYGGGVGVVIHGLLGLIMGTLPSLRLALVAFNAAAVVDNYVTCLPGAVGLLVVGPALFQLTRFPVELRWQIIVPAIAILVVFSTPSVPILHGYQPIVGTLIFLGLISLHDAVSLLAFRVLLFLQLLCNVGLIAMQAWVVGVHA